MPTRNGENWALVVPKSESIGTFKIWIGLECNLLQKPMFYRTGRYRLQKDTYFKEWSILNKCQKCRMGMANNLKNILEYNFSYLCIFMNLPKVEYFEEGTRNSRKVVKKMASAFEAAACHLGANVAFSGPAQCMVPCVHNECGSIFFHCYRC